MIMNQALDEELSRPLDGVIKGVPHLASVGETPVTARQVSSKGWNLLRGDLPFPNVVIRESDLHHNLKWMRRFADRMGVLLCPHGKTTMAPQLFHRQLEHGAWGITVATVQQLHVCRKFGIGRLFLANQLVSRGDIEYVIGELRRDPGFEFYCLVDSVQGVERLEEVCISHGGTGIRVLLEVGIPGGRAGCRTLKQAVVILEAIGDSSRVSLCGIECYEGIAASGEDETDLVKVDAFFELFGAVHAHCVRRRLFDPDIPVILSAGGSVYFDVAGRALLNLAKKGARVLIRSGCYITHDSLFYRRMAERFAERNPEYGGDGNGLRPALEVWGQIQSLPEPGLAIVCVGKRDVSHDIEYPVPQMHFRSGAHQRPASVEGSWKVTDLNDQHARLLVPERADLAVGDLVGFGISHPCTTFDKWRLVWLVDDSYQVTGAVWTYF